MIAYEKYCKEPDAKEISFETFVETYYADQNKNSNEDEKTNWWSDRYGTIEMPNSYIPKEERLRPDQFRRNLHIDGSEWNWILLSMSSVLIGTYMSTKLKYVLFISNTYL